MFGYGLLGAGWLVIKTEGALQDWARALGRWCLIGTVVAIGIVSLWTPLANAHIAARWFSWPHIAFLAPVPLITAALVWYAWRSLNNRVRVRALHRRAWACSSCPISASPSACGR